MLLDPNDLRISFACTCFAGTKFVETDAKCDIIFAYAKELHLSYRLIRSYLRLYE